MPEYRRPNNLDSIHFNPVIHGLVQRAADWLWSSFHRYVKLGYYEINWGEADESARLQTIPGED